MSADLYELLKEKHLEALRAYHAHPTLAAAAHSLGISESTLNHRVAEARNILDLGSSREAAQWVAAHEQKLGFSRISEESGDGRFSPGSFSPIEPPPLTPSDVAETAIEDDDEDGHVGEPAPQWIAPSPARKARIPWPFPTPGREVNRAGWAMRLVMVLSAALILIVGGLLFAALVVGFQDELAQIQHFIARLT
ncbi:hypothetical protein [Sphingomonas oryzagri]